MTKLKPAEGRYLVKLARESINTFVKTLGPPPIPTNYPQVLDEERGVFCTLHTFPTKQLRGCIGLPYPIKSLLHATIEAACSSTQDPRFPPIGQKELGAITVEVSVLTVPELISVDKPQDYLDKISLGKDGLILQYKGQSGLLLPQVPKEQDWDLKQYLEGICNKAGLYPDMWVDPQIKLFKFQTQIFSEKKPKK